MPEDDELERLRRRVTELEAELARERAKIEAIFVNIPAVFYVKDREGRYQYGSPHGFAQFGIEAGHAMGRTDEEIFPPELAARFRASDERILQGQTVKEDSYAIPVLGGPRHFAGVRFPVRDPDGETVGVCGFAVDVTDRVELQRELERLATTDGLTGLANRRRLDEVLEAELARAGRTGEPLSFLLCDVDHFKRYNDALGHTEGDACLARVARAVADAARRPADLAARYGGEELAIVLPETTEEGARRVADALAASVRALGVPHPDGGPSGVVTISVGVAAVVGAWTRREIVGLADAALYDAKRRGRDQVVVARGEHPPASARLRP